MKGNGKLLISLVVAGILIPFALAFFSKTTGFVDEITIAIINAASTVIVAVIGILPEMIKKKSDEKKKINISVKGHTVEDVAAGDININTTVSSHSEHSESESGEKSVTVSVKGKKIGAVAGGNINKHTKN